MLETIHSQLAMSGRTRLLPIRGPMRTGLYYFRPGSAHPVFLDMDIFNVPNEDCISFLDPLIARWDIDLSTFEMEITLNKRLAPGEPKVFAFVEKTYDSLCGDEPGLTDFQQDPVLSSDLSEAELALLRMLTFKTKRPNRLYYYRSLQNLRDPLHFLVSE